LNLLLLLLAETMASVYTDNKCYDDQDPCECPGLSPAAAPVVVVPSEGESLGCYTFHITDGGTGAVKGSTRAEDGTEKITSATAEHGGWSFYGLEEEHFNWYGGMDFNSCLNLAIAKNKLYFGMGHDASQRSGGMSPGGQAHCLLFDDSGNPNIFSQPPPVNPRTCCNKYSTHTNQCFGSSNGFVVYATGIGSFPNQPVPAKDVWADNGCPNC
jgi:hypothetical protein